MREEGRGEERGRGVGECYNKTRVHTHTHTLHDLWIISLSFSHTSV